MFDWKFYIFLYPELIKKYKIINKDNAYAHWIHIGRYEGKIGYHIDENIFNWKDYLKNNSFLIKEGIKDKRGAILHWYNVGKNLGLQISKYKNNENHNIRNLIKYENNNNFADSKNDTKYIKLIVHNDIENNINLKDYSSNRYTQTKPKISKKNINVTKINPKISHNTKINPIITTIKKPLQENTKVKDKTDLCNSDKVDNQISINEDNLFENDKILINKKVIENNNFKIKYNNNKLTKYFNISNLKNETNFNEPVENKLKNLKNDKNFNESVENKLENSKNEINFTEPLEIKSVNLKMNQPKIHYFEKLNNSDKIIPSTISNNLSQNSENMNNNNNIKIFKNNSEIDNSNIEVFHNIENNFELQYISKLINVNILIKYYYDNINFLLNTLNYYRNYTNIIIFIENIEDYIINIANFYNIKIYNINNYNNILSNNSNITFIGELYNNIVIDKIFLDSHQENKIYKKIKFGKCNYLSPIELVENINNDKNLNMISKNNNIFIELYLENILKNLNIQHKESIRSKFFIKNIDILNNIENTSIENYNSKENFLYNIVDNIYLLNLYRRVDRFNNSVERLNEIGIYNFEQFYAIDGCNKIISTLYSYYYSKLSLSCKEKNLGYIKYIPSSGSLAILFSMKNMLFDAIRQDYSKILVLQDDIFFIDNFYERLEEQLKIIKNIDWKLLYLGANDRNLRNKGDEELNKIKKNKYYFAEGNIDGAFGVIINNSIFIELIEEIDKFNLPFDSGPLKTIQKKYMKECIVLYPNLIIADVTESDCRHSRNQQIFSKDLLWNLDEYKLIYCNTPNYPKITLIIFDKSEKFTEDIFENINNLYNECIFNNFSINIIILTSLTDSNKSKNNIFILKINNINDEFNNINLGISMSTTKYIKIILLDNFSKDFMINFIKNRDYIEENYSLLYEKDSIDIYNYIFLKYDYFYNISNNLQGKFNELKNIDNKYLVSYTENNINNINII